MSRDSNAAGLSINWHCFGSNGHETADYSRGVLERFTRRAPNDWLANKHVKTIANPRRIDFFFTAHNPDYFEGFYSVNEDGGRVLGPFNEPPNSNKIVLNHYHTKSREEYRIRKSFFLSPGKSFSRFEKQFESHDRNEVFDDGILKYRDARAKNFSLETNDEKLNRVTAALNKTLSDFANEKISDLETALTCRALSNYLDLKLHEEASLAAILNSLDSSKLSDARLLIRELPDLLSLPYPAVKDLRVAVINIIPQLMNLFHLNNMWKDYFELDYLQRLLRNFKE